MSPMLQDVHSYRRGLMRSSNSPVSNRPRSRIWSRQSSDHWSPSERNGRPRSGDVGRSSAWFERTLSPIARANSYLEYESYRPGVDSRRSSFDPHRYTEDSQTHEQHFQNYSSIRSQESRQNPQVSHRPQLVDVRTDTYNGDIDISRVPNGPSQEIAYMSDHDRQTPHVKISLEASPTNPSIIRFQLSFLPHLRKFLKICGISEWLRLALDEKGCSICFLKGTSGQIALDACEQGLTGRLFFGDYPIRLEKYRNGRTPYRVPMAGAQQQKEQPKTMLHEGPSQELNTDLPHSESSRVLSIAFLTETPPDTPPAESRNHSAPVEGRMYVVDAFGRHLEVTDLPKEKKFMKILGKISKSHSFPNPFDDLTARSATKSPAKRRQTVAGPSKRPIRKSAGVPAAGLSTRQLRPDAPTEVDTDDSGPAKKRQRRGGLAAIHLSNLSWIDVAVLAMRHAPATGWNYVAVTQWLKDNLWEYMSDRPQYGRCIGPTLATHACKKRALWKRPDPQIANYVLLPGLETKYNLVELDAKFEKERKRQSDIHLGLLASAPKAIEPKAIEPKAIEPKAVEPKAIELKAIEPKLIEPKSIEPKAIEPKASEPKAIEPKSIEPKSIEPKVNPQSSATMKNPERNRPGEKVLSPTAEPPEVVASPRELQDPLATVRARKSAPTSSIYHVATKLALSASKRPGMDGKIGVLKEHPLATNGTVNALRPAKPGSVPLSLADWLQPQDQAERLDDLSALEAFLSADAASHEFIQEEPIPGISETKIPKVAHRPSTPRKPYRTFLHFSRHLRPLKIEPWKERLRQVYSPPPPATESTTVVLRGDRRGLRGREVLSFQELFGLPDDHVLGMGDEILACILGRRG